MRYGSIAPVVLALVGSPVLALPLEVGAPAVGDFTNASPGNEILTIGDDGAPYLWLEGGKLANGWPYSMGQRWIVGQPEVVDAVGADGILEAIFLTETYSGSHDLLTIAGDGSVCAGCYGGDLGDRFASMSFGNVTTTSNGQIVLGGETDGRVVVVDYLASLGVAAVATPGVSGAPVFVTVADVDADPEEEIIFACRGANAPGLIGVLDWVSGVLQASTILETPARATSAPVVANVTVGAEPEIVVATEDGSLYLLTLVGSNWQLMSGWPVQAGARTRSAPIVGQISLAEGDLEVVVGVGTDGVHAWKATAQAVDGFPVHYGVHGNSGVALGDVLIGSGSEMVFSPGGRDLLFLKGSDFQQAEYVGEVYHRFLGAGGPIAVEGDPLVDVYVNDKLVGGPFKSGDFVQSDVKIVVVPRAKAGFALEGGTTVKVFDDLGPVLEESSQDELEVAVQGRFMPGRYSAEIASQRTGQLSAEFQFVVEERLAIRDLLCYPNPMRGRAAFTLQLSKSADVGLTIYTVTGKAICRMEQRCEAGFSTIPWDGRDDRGDRIASGTYLFRVEARAGDERTEQISTVICLSR